jgi:hypothetical protein
MGEQRANDLQIIFGEPELLKFRALWSNPAKVAEMFSKLQKSAMPLRSRSVETA